MVRPISLFLILLAALPVNADVSSYVQKQCAGCHNASVKSGDVDLASLKPPATFEHDREVWEKVVEKLKTGQMPPPGMPRPPAADTTATIAFLESEFARQDKLIKPSVGRVTARRMNRAEYNNTIRDLLAIDIRPADNFPADAAAFGFDNVSDALYLSPVLLENYMDAAERSVRTALFGPEQRKPSAIHLSAPVRLNLARGQNILPKDLFHYDETGLSTRHSAHFTHRFPVDAEYTFHLVLNGHRPNQSEPAHPALFIDNKLVASTDYDATDLEGQAVDFRTRVAAGEHLISLSYLKMYEGLPPSYKGPNPSTRPPEALISTRGALTEKDIEVLRKFGTKIKPDTIEARVDMRYEALDIGGPFNQRAGASPESLKRIMVCAQKTPACARTIVSTFATKAFRRPATPAEVNEFATFAALAQKQGDSFEEGIATALEAVLVSPKFLYRMESTPKTAEPERVTGFELASRLSYFLWSSMPDATLLAAAKQGALEKPATLRAQVKRMLLDPKASAFAQNFAGQWLQLRNVDVLRPDLEKFPMFDDGLRQAMRIETEMFFADLMRRDARVTELIDADHTFMNERLARFYGVPNVTGPEYRRVDVSATERGGGILSHASVLLVSSYSTRTSPVLRGKWILENLLNAPPPPPPPGVPALDDTKTGQSGTLRQQMEEHRKNPVCSSCHSRMDPLGFGLENFDAIGAWRTMDGKFPVDSTGQLPDGRSFKTPRELKTLLLADKDVFVRAMTEKMLLYALGRGVERFDRPTINDIVERVKSNDYRFSAMAESIIESLPFQKKAPPTTTEKPVTADNKNRANQERAK